MLKEIFYNALDWRKSIVTQISTRKINQHPGTYMHDYERKQSAQLMRVNHIGEICAQALYIGQLLTARNEALKSSLYEAKEEEVDHLVWCNDALKRLHANPSLIVPIWFTGALILSIGFSILGDEHNALFLEETELQVAKHLEHHLSIMPWSDYTSIEILKTMLDEELEHAKKAKAFTKNTMHPALKEIMKFNSKVMTFLGLYV